MFFFTIVFRLWLVPDFCLEVVFINFSAKAFQIFSDYCILGVAGTGFLLENPLAQFFLLVL